MPICGIQVVAMVILSMSAQCSFDLNFPRVTRNKRAFFLTLNLLILLLLSFSYILHNTCVYGWACILLCVYIRVCSCAVLEILFKESQFWLSTPTNRLWNFCFELSTKKILAQILVYRRKGIQESFSSSYSSILLLLLFFFFFEISPTHLWAFSATIAHQRFQSYIYFSFFVSRYSLPFSYSVNFSSIDIPLLLSSIILPIHSVPHAHFSLLLYIDFFGAFCSQKDIFFWWFFKNSLTFAPGFKSTSSLTSSSIINLERHYYISALAHD